MFHYLIYGLGISSEIRLYQLEQYTGDSEEVFIHYGAVTEDIEGSIDKGISSSMSPNRAWFINDTGIFVIANGNEIMIQATEDATEDDVASFVLGWCMAYLFQQRGMPAIHCSALEMHDRAVLIAGNSGAGKSTLTLSLLDAGYRYLVDDIAMVDMQNDMMVPPAFPQQKVCRDVAESMQDASLFYINERKDKFAYINEEQFCPDAKKLGAIFLIDKYEGDVVKVERLKGLAKWNGIMKNLFLRDAYQAFQFFPPEERNRCLEIAGKVEVYSISRPQGKDTVAEITDRIIELAKG